MDFDVIVVGAGAAGCVVAARLSEDGQRSVALLEAGTDYSAYGDWPEAVGDATAMPADDDWGYQSTPSDTAGPVRLPRGRLVGGSSAVNFCMALHSRPEDHRAWAALGLPEWSWDEVLPYYRRVENDPDGDDRWHGRSGPVAVRRHRAEDLSVSQAAFLAACAAAGHQPVADHNDPASLGAGISPLNQLEGRRRHAALSYLAPALGRPNLTVRGDAEVDAVIVTNGRATGVRLASGEEIRAGEVVLSAGAYNSPAILMRSGIGPAEQLREHGVRVLLDLPGVGADLIEHPSYYTVFAAREHNTRHVAPLSTTLTLKSSPGLPDADLHIQARTALPTRSSGPHPTGLDFMMVVGLLQPESRGSVRLRSAKPSDAPVIDLGLFQEQADVDRVVAGVAAAHRIAAQQPLSDLLVPVPPPVAGPALERAIRAAPFVYHHPLGTCRMGTDQDPGAVVDSHCRVRGVDGLMVVDASVMPVTVRAATHLPVLMLAERAVDLIRG